MVQSNKPVRSGWVGWVYFAAFMLVLTGFFQIIVGLTALLNDTYFVAVKSTLLVLDFTTWGWVHLGFGVITLLAGMSLFNGSTWARVVAILLAVLNLLTQFAFVSVYPVWSIIMMVVDVLVIYALTVHGGEVRDDE